MILIAEIILTFFAWKKWKWLAILPIGIAFTIGLLIGMSGVTVDYSIIFIDVLAVIALIIMNIFGPKTPTVPPTKS